MTPDEVAAFLRIPRANVYKLARKKAIPAFRLGKHWRFTRPAIEAWLATQTAVTPVSSQPEESR